MNHFDQPLDPPAEAAQPAASPRDPSVLRILHVEDNPADALLMQEYIRDASRQWNLGPSGGTPTAGRAVYTTVEFDLAERLAEVTPDRAHAADCAILDLSLPDASDLQALISLRGMSEDLPIIVLTGFDDLDTGLAALRRGADDYLVKSQVDGFTLDRAVRYAIARRRLNRDVAAAAAATTLDTATVIMSAAIQAKASRANGSDGPSPGIATPSPELARGTHQISVQIESTGEYSLHCLSCSWKADRGPENLHTWVERSLDWVLLRHMAFGDLPDVVSTLPVPPSQDVGMTAPPPTAPGGGRRMRVTS